MFHLFLWWRHRKEEKMKWPRHPEHFSSISTFSPSPAPTLQACSPSTEQSCSHLTGHSDLGFGRRMRPQSVRLGVHEAHSDEEGSEQPVEEGVVPKELGRYVHISQHLATGNSFNWTQQNILDTKQSKMIRGSSFLLPRWVCPRFPSAAERSPSPPHLGHRTHSGQSDGHSVGSSTVWTLDQTRVHH